MSSRFRLVVMGPITTTFPISPVPGDVVEVTTDNDGQDGYVTEMTRRWLRSDGLGVLVQEESEPIVVAHPDPHPEFDKLSAHLEALQEIYLDIAERRDMNQLFRQDFLGV